MDAQSIQGKQRDNVFSLSVWKQNVHLYVFIQKCIFEGTSFANKMFRSHEQNHHMKPAEWKKKLKSVSQGVCFVIFFVACLLFMCIWAGGTVQVSFSRSVFSDSVCGVSAVHIYLDRWDCLSQFLKGCVLILCVACLSGQVGLFKLVSQGVCFDSVCGMSVWTGGTI